MSTLSKVQAQGTGGGNSNKCIVWPLLLKHPPAADAKFWELMNNSRRPLSRLNNVTLLLSGRIFTPLSPNHLNGSLIGLQDLTEAAAFKNAAYIHLPFLYSCLSPLALISPAILLSLICFFLSLFFYLSKDTPSQSQTTTAQT